MSLNIPLWCCAWLRRKQDNPVNDNDGSLIACGNQRWCCKPDADVGDCDCESGDGTFLVDEGLAQKTIGVDNSIQQTSIESTSVWSSQSQYLGPTTTSVLLITSHTTLLVSPTSTEAPASSSHSPSTTPSPNKDDHIRLKAGIPAGVGGGIVLFCCIILFCIGYRRRQQRRRDAAGTESPDTDHPDRTANVAQPTHSPEPNPYDIPLQQYAQRNRSQYTAELIPDHDAEQPRRTDLRYPPPFDQYNIPQPPLNAFRNQERYWSTAPPSYRTNPPSPPPRRRPVPGFHGSTISEVSQ